MHALVRAVLVGTALLPASFAHADPETPAEPPANPAKDSPPVPVAPVVQRPAQPVPQPAPRFTWEPFGYLRLQYIAVQDDPNVQYVGRDDGFELQNARIGVRGTLALSPDRIAAFVVDFDGAVDERAQINSPDGKLQVRLRDAYTDVPLTGNGNLFARAGYFEPWVDPQALIPDTTRELVDLPIESRGMRATEGYQTPGLYPDRSLGVALRLDRDAPADEIRPAFELAIQNGADEYASNNDNNTPAVSASFLLRLPHQGFLLVAGRYNQRTLGDLPFRQDETDLQGSVGLRVLAGPASIEAGAVVVHTTYETTGGPSADAYGAHGQVMIRINGDAAMPASVGYRFGVIDPSSLITTDRVMEHTAAALLVVPKLRMRFQLQLTHVDEQAARALTNDRVQLAAEVVL